MTLIVQKYGGTSVSNIQKISLIASRIRDLKLANNDLIIVVSAKAGVTDNLLNEARQLTDKPDTRALDFLLFSGEQETVGLLSIALNGLGIKTIGLTGSQAGILTDNVHKHASIRHVRTQPVAQMLKDGYVVVIAGFQGISEEDNSLTTLGRGGSDLTAIALAYYFGAQKCQIFTDVSGIFSVDPRLIENTSLISNISLENLSNFTSLGAKIMQNEAVVFAQKNSVEFEIGLYTNGLIGTQVSIKNESNFKGIALKYNQYLYTLPDIDIPDKIELDSTKIAQNISNRVPEFDFITQATDELFGTQNEMFQSEKNFPKKGMLTNALKNFNHNKKQESFLKAIQAQRIPIVVLSQKGRLFYCFNMEDRDAMIDIIKQFTKSLPVTFWGPMTKVSIIGNEIENSKKFIENYSQDGIVFEIKNGFSVIIEPHLANDFAKKLHSKLILKENSREQLQSPDQLYISSI